MLTRLTHSAIAFAVTVVVYQVYVLVAAPLIDPPVAARPQQQLTAEEREAAREATHKYRELLAAYFPPGHWTLTQPPITAENNKAMLVLDEFTPRDDGQIRVRKCAMLFFPTGRVRGEAPPSDAVILEAPQGAVLQMDKSYRSNAGGFGKLQRGRLMGQITVRSDMREPGPADDLRLVTRDVELREDLIVTNDHVEMQLGPHRGSGRQLEIRLIAVERGRAGNSDSGIGTIDSIEIVKDVQAEISPAAWQHNPNLPAAPVRISSDGRFRFDFIKQIASFDEHVQLAQVHPQGQLDQIHCEQLAIYFASNLSALEATPATPLGKFQPTLVEANGSERAAVLFDLQSQAATARTERVRIELPAQRITFDRGDRAVTAQYRTRQPQDVELTYEGNEIHAPQVQYQLPPKESNHKIGKLLAAGSGWLRVRTSDKQNAEPFDVRWTENLRLRRINDKPVLTINGRPRLDLVGMGRLWADHLDLYLRELDDQEANSNSLSSNVLPDRLVASGKIAIDSAQLRGKTQQLDVEFQYAPSQLQLGSAEGESDRARPGRLDRNKSRGSRAYDITGNTLQMMVTMFDKDLEVTSIDVDGQVVFNEAAPQAAQGEALRVVGDHLRVEQADSPDARIALVGKPATITAGGIAIRTENLQINRGESRAWVDAPGEIEMLVDRDFSGKQLPGPQPLHIRWQKSLQLERDQLTFLGNVQILTGEGSLDTQQLTVQLSSPVQFDGAADQRRLDIAQLECAGGAQAIFSQRDAMGLSSIQTINLEESLRVNLQTGQIEGHGPGKVESVHLASASSSWSGLASTPNQNRLASARSQNSGAQRLRFLGVEFVRGVRGTLDAHRGRRVELLGDVAAVYGPVDAWEQRLALTNRGMPGPDTIWIRSQSLQVAESPLARLDRNQSDGLGPLELLARGNPTNDVTIEGPAGDRGNFTTRSLLAKYDQAKKTFILEGNNQQPATILFQEYRGGPTSPTSARKITYFQENGDVKVEGLMSGQIRQLAPGR